MLKSLQAGLLAALIAAPAFAAEPAINWNQPAQTARPLQARIAFARQGGIDNWEVTDEKTIYVQDRHRQWYRGDLMGTCIGLRFAQRIGFTFEPDGSFDKFSAIRYDHQTCQLTSLTMSDPPKGQKGKLSPDAAHQAEGAAKDAATQDAELRDPT